MLRAISSQVKLKLLPTRCLFDEPVQVKVAGLRSRQVVTMRARTTDDKGVEFSSSASYRADGNGEIDLNTDPSLSGSYVGVEPMGLLWSMKGNVLHEMFRKKIVANPSIVKFSVHEEEGKMLAEATNERYLMADGVSQVPVKEGNIHGVLFTPPGEGPFPAVVHICTYMDERRVCLLANKGFMVLVVPVFYDKPENVKNIHLDRFEEAVRFLQQHPKVGSKGVGVISRSKGGDVALSLSSFVSGVEAVVSINSCSANTLLPLFYKKKQILPPLMYDEEKAVPTESGAFNIKHAIHDHLKEENRASLIPIERANSRFLFVASEDDLHLDSKTYMNHMVERLKHHGKENFETTDQSCWGVSPGPTLQLKSTCGRKSRSSSRLT